ncbi:MAG: DUF6174 domain-containing protein [Kangiellaceae bacterium]
MFLKRYYFGIFTKIVFLSSRKSSLRTIEQHFDIIDEAISDNGFRLEVEYHPEFGFPTVISIDYAVNVEDDEVAYYLSNLQ